jgi:NAD(P)-dependent dehydrogenase (short-subunit alcohol dehydrogenase family)
MMVDNLQVNLSGKVIAVTGGFGALGAAVAEVLGRLGAQVARLDPAPAPAPAGLAAGALAFGGIDLADESAAVAAMAKIVQATGRLDGLVNIAGGFHFEQLDGGALDTWDSMYRMNLRTAVSCCKAALPHLLKAGSARIVNVGAMGAVKAGAGMGAYAASKSGVAKLTEALAEELKDRGVTVNAVLPSTMDTARNRIDMPTADFSRWVTPSSMGEVIAFLLSEAAGVVTGALIPVSGRT